MWSFNVQQLVGVHSICQLQNHVSGLETPATTQMQYICLLQQDTFITQ